MEDEKSEMDGVAVRRAPVAWQEPALVCLLVAALAGWGIYYSCWQLPARRHAALDTEIATLENRYAERDLAGADHMARDLLGSGRIHDPRQTSRLEVLLQHIAETRSRYRCHVTFATVPAAAMVAVASDRRIESGASLPPGAYTCTISASGFESQTRQFVLESDGQVADLGTIHLARLQGRLAIALLTPEVGYRLSQTESEGAVPGEFATLNEQHRPFDGDVPSGSYQATWSENGVFLGKDSLIVRAGGTAQLARRFDPIPVAIESDPPGATLSISGEPHPRGQLPRTLMLRPSTYQMTAQYDNWPAMKKQIEVKPGPGTRLQFEWDYSQIRFESDPGGAIVYLGVEQIGKAPFSRPFPAGSYRFTARCAHLDAKEEAVEVRKRDPRTLTFAFFYGTVDVVSQPTDAEILLPGLKDSPNPHTPYTFHVRPGVVRFNIVKPGYESLPVTRSVPPYEVSRISATLEPR